MSLYSSEGVWEEIGMSSDFMRCHCFGALRLLFFFVWVVRRSVHFFNIYRVAANPVVCFVLFGAPPIARRGIFGFRAVFLLVFLCSDVPSRIVLILRRAPSSRCRCVSAAATHLLASCQLALAVNFNAFRLRMKVSLRLP